VTSDPYSEAVRSLFADTAHAGELAGEHAVIARGEACESREGARLVLVAGFDGDTTAELR